jgi:hypothetical protein
VQGEASRWTPRPAQASAWRNVGCAPQTISGVTRRVNGSPRLPDRQGMRELLSTLDGSRAARIAMLAGMTREELGSVGGVEEDG